MKHQRDAEPDDAGPDDEGQPVAADQDWTDDHVARWRTALPDLDPDIEGAVTRMQRLVTHLKRVHEQSLADFGLQKHEYDTLQALVARGGSASPSALAADLDIAPASVTGRLDGLHRRGFVRRTPSPTDRRRVDVELTEAGHAGWLGAVGAVGHEEHRLLAPLTPAERHTLSSMLRRVMLPAEAPHGHP
ncbi:MarR family transcriptional regulator [Streptomyces sp. N2-109]|uniref:MarR family transcriptional regulator n=1 Tax=Streptomyces gossypii TaxID=2883101 RepID=A0ABT2K2V9_9ACTN|nr:MarR family transcriptional regulator [Streptomyces gossypii]MCT2594508.1 MarR family transcriptional regulator [Streptomyces gossypii]